VLAYEAGALYLQRKEYEIAAQWLAIAQKEAVTIQATNLIAASTHALALAQTGLEKYDEAAENLNLAIINWGKLKNYYELASAHQAVGHLENKRKQPERALESLQKALELCMQTAPSNQRTRLEGHIRETIDEIPW
jgi:tetratricopeptide (TPR) repeat protein